MSLRISDWAPAARRGAILAASLLAASAIPIAAQDAAGENAKKVVPLLYEVLLVDADPCPLVVAPGRVTLSLLDPSDPMAEPPPEVTLCGETFTSTSSIQVAGEDVVARFVDETTLVFALEQAFALTLVREGLLAPTMNTGTFPVVVDGTEIGDITLSIPAG